MPEKRENEISVHSTCTLDTNQIKGVFNSMKDQIFHKKLEEVGL